MQDIINGIFGEALKWPIWIVIVVVLVLVAYALEWWPKFPNWLVMPVMFAGGVILYMLLGDPKLIPAGQRNPNLVLALYGLILGAIAWGVKKQVLERFGLKLPQADLPAPTEREIAKVNKPVKEA